MISCLPRNKNQAFNPFLSSNFTDIVFNLISNNGRYYNDEYADYLFAEKKFNVFNITDYKNNDFCWHENYILSISIDFLEPQDILFGLEEGQIFVLPCCIMNKYFREIFNENNILIGRYTINEKNIHEAKNNKQTKAKNHE